MRIALANWSFRRVGGIEAYLDEIVPQLGAAGYELACLCEVDVPADRERVRLPSDCRLWCASSMGRVEALAAAREWRPDVIYVHKILDPGFEEQLLGLAPAVRFVHDFNGMCISGLKTFKFPRIRPCSRTFGWPCLVHYFPRRCGGSSPFTMWRLFKMQSRHLGLLRRYQAILTHSAYMRSELLKHGLPPETVHNSHYLIENGKLQGEARSLVIQPGDAQAYRTTPARLLFAGRMDRPKGGAILIDALPAVAAALERPLQLTFAGDGPARLAWEKRAQAIQKRHPEIRIQYFGWLDNTRLQRLFSKSDLLVVPSLLPEGFGRVGLEAGLCSLPGAAFGVGGISDWLIDGVNGRVAPGDPPTRAGLTQAIVDCLQDYTTHQTLRDGALRMAQRFSPANHTAQLFRLFECVAEPRFERPIQYPYRRGAGSLPQTLE